MIFSWIRRKRIKYAFKFGKLEHRFGRLISIPILVNIIYCCYFELLFPLVVSSITFICWLIYILSHKLEKKLFGSNGPRSGWGKKRC